MADLLDNLPGQSVMAQALLLQQRAQPPHGLAKVLGASPIPRQARSWVAGALGEQAVAARLARLDPAWTVLHAVPVGRRGRDIDHVVIGPGGVFTVNTKHHAGRRVRVGPRQVRVDGRPTPYLRDSRHEAERAAVLLGAQTGQAVPVRALIVVVDAASLTLGQQPEDVTVLTDVDLLRWLGRRTPVLDPDEVAALVAAARRPQTWTTADLPAQDSAAIVEAFAAVLRQDDAARVRRVAWATAGVALPAALALLGTLR